MRHHLKGRFSASIPAEFVAIIHQIKRAPAPRGGDSGLPPARDPQGRMWNGRRKANAPRGMAGGASKIGAD
jgi:hypothetical protein